MAETMRAISAIQTLLANNALGAISPTDLRDALIATALPGHGEISVTSSAATTLSDTSTWVEVAGTYALTSTPTAMNWAMATNARLDYTGAAGRVLHIAATVGMTCVSNNQVTEWAIAKNGTVLTPSITRSKIGTGADVGSTAIHGHTNVVNGDYISVMCRNTTAANNVTAEKLNLFAMDMAE